VEELSNLSTTKQGSCTTWQTTDSRVEQDKATVHVRVYALANASYKLKGSVKEPNMFHNYETEKITRKASDAAEYIGLFGSSTRDRHPGCI